MPCGSADDVLGRLRRFVDAGLTHVTILNVAPTCGAAIAVKSLVEQRRLIRRLKQMPLASAWPGVARDVPVHQGAGSRIA
jgi:hypothetical protein